MTQDKLTRIYLYGSLRKYCDNLPHIDLYAPSLKMAVQALVCRFGEGVKDIIEKNNWQIYSKKYTGKHSAKYAFTEEQVNQKIYSDSLHFYPAVEGAGRVGRVIADILYYKPEEIKRILLMSGIS